MKPYRLPGTVRHEVQVLVDQADREATERSRYLDEVMARYDTFCAPRVRRDA